MIVVADAAKSLSEAIDGIRAKAGVDKLFPLKFNPGPKHLSHAEFIALKQAVIDAAAAHGVQLITSLILHDIASSAEEARRNEINRLCYHFDCILRQNKDSGLVLIDRFSDKQIDAHLVKKFSVGVIGLPHSREYRLANIVGLHYSAIGQSHFSSLVDVVTGSLRYAINAFTRQEKEKLKTATAILKALSPLFIRDGGDSKISELSVFFSPKAIKVAKYRQKYEELKSFFADNGLETAQRMDTDE